jgi:hypothetical protein
VTTTCNLGACFARHRVRSQKSSSNRTIDRDSSPFRVEPAWRKKHARGDVIVVRYADDNVLGFQYRAEADRFLEEFRERLAKFGQELHPDKTRRIEFGRFAQQNREQEERESLKR